jgi:hypothetical protein
VLYKIDFYRVNYMQRVGQCASIMLISHPTVDTIKCGADIILSHHTQMQ